MNNIVIGIGGQKHSGKDTFASMLLYINSVGPAAANYNIWYEHFLIPTFNGKLRIAHFADSLKDSCSVLFQIERKLFDNISYKDDKYYSFRDNKFLDEKEITIDQQRLAPTDLLDFNNFAEKIANNPDAPLIKIRNLMTTFADSMKYVFGEDVFVNSTIRKINSIINAYHFCVVPDVRFTNEVVALHQSDDTWQGYVIKLIRPDEKQTENLHNSEVCDFDCDYTIINDGSLFNLFYKAIEVYNKIVFETTKRNEIKRAMYELKKES
ncbi:MAG: hypothetical protein J6M39_06555 [Lachnospiraceae bacterium]|nr:hypothetical protein [Lachnospiraceae bacterium]